MSHFKKRMNEVKHPIAKQILELAIRKRTNICLSLDVSTCTEFLDILNKLGPFIVIVKTHIDILNDFTPGFIKDLQKLAQQHEFLIFEDRKFADIGNTAKLQYEQGIFKIASWANAVTCHALPGASMIKALAEVGQPLNRAGFMLVQLSSSGNLLNTNYQEQAIKMAEQYPEFIAGFISQQSYPGTQAFLYLTPGINLNAKNDNLGQQYKTPEQAMKEGSDILIIGRSLYQNDDPIKEIQKYLSQIADQF